MAEIRGLIIKKDRKKRKREKGREGKAQNRKEQERKDTGTASGFLKLGEPVRSMSLQGLWLRRREPRE